MNHQIFERFADLIAARTGLQARPKDEDDWTRALQTRMKARRIDAPQDYLRLLEASGLENAAANHSASKAATSKANFDSASEWRQLLPLLTNGESYFLRDKGQFALLRNRILPDLIDARREPRSLRIWSAGCSTGEEPYSLAMLVQELVPSGWDVSIWGTDVNELSLQKARRGVYTNWSFRSVEADLRARYFQANATGFELKPEIRAMVRFEADNLCEDKHQSQNLRDMDLILCRNVLIYFRREAMARALSRFATALRDGGYLLTGHAELHHHDPAPLKTRVFPESVAYQRENEAISGSRPHESRFQSGSNEPLSVVPRSMPARVMSNAVSGKDSTFKAALPHAVASLASPRARMTPTPLPTPPTVVPFEETLPNLMTLPSLTTEELCRRARASANAGQYEAAIQDCRQALIQDAMAVEAYVIWAQVAGEQGRREEAKNLFKKVIYLAPSRFEAYLELGALYDAEGDTARARRMHSAALDGLRLAARDAKNDGKSEAKSTMEAMMRHLESLLAKPPGSRSS